MRNRQGITIAALIIAIIGLSIGFAAFSNTLTIRSTATVTPGSENFVVKFSKISSDDQTGSSYPITPIIDNELATAGVTGANGIIDSTNPLLLTGLKANFTAPGQSVSYKLYVRNTGHYTAYLTNINFLNVSGNNKIVCDGLNGATESLVQDACADMSISVMIGGTDGQGGTTYTTDNNNITGKSLTALTGYTEVYVTITYADNSPSANHYVDGPMTVVFGDIALQYKSNPTPDNSIVVEPEEPELPEYVVDSNGVIRVYFGEGGNITIPSSLPYYSEGEPVFYYDLCVEGVGTEACDAYKEDFDENGSSMEDYDDLVLYRVISPKYIPTGTNITVTGIGEDAFQDCDLTAVTLPNTITSIGDDAFSYNQLTSITIPNSVTSIGARAFKFNNLTTVTIGTSTNGSNIVTIGTNAFGAGEDDGYGSNSLTTVTIHASCNNFKVPSAQGYSVSLTNNGQFTGFSGNITWDTACSE